MIVITASKNSFLFCLFIKDLPSKDPVRHGRKKKNKLGGRRERRKHKCKNGLAKIYGEKEYLVHNRTLELLGKSFTLLSIKIFQISFLNMKDLAN